MTTEEKLSSFETTCLDDAREKLSRALADYRNGLESALKEHEQRAMWRANSRVKSEEEKIIREYRKQTAENEISLRREVSRKQEELKDMLFTELKNRLADFMSTESYVYWLNQCVKEAIEVAAGEAVTIYFDPSDTDKIPRIAMRNSADIVVSRYSFGGGMRAKIPTRNILIDRSFDSLVEEMRSKYNIEGGIG